MTTSAVGGSFWRDAWALAASAQTAESAEEVSGVLQRLTDATLQRFVFQWRHVSNPALLAGLTNSPLLDEPPNLPWAVLEYLRSQVNREPEAVAAASLRAAENASGQVLEELLRISMGLPEQQRLEVCNRLSERWLANEPGWFDSQLWGSVLETLMLRPADLYYLAGELLNAGASRGSSEYELDEVLETVVRIGRQAAGAEPQVALDALLGAVETALAARLALDDGYWADLSLVDLLQMHHREPGAGFVSTWLDLQALLTMPRLGHSLRLLSFSQPVLKQLGLRALGASLRVGPTREATGALEQLLLQDELLQERATRSELLRLVGIAYSSISDEAQIRYLENALELAREDNFPSRYRSRDMLAAVRNALGPRERRQLQQLEQELGPYSPDTPSVRVSAGWVERRGEWSEQQLRAASLADFWALMRQRLFWNASDPERARFELYESVRAFATSRPDDVLSASLPADVQDPGVHEALVEGLGAAVRNLSGKQLEDLVGFLQRSYAQFRGPDGTGVRSAAQRAALSIVELLTQSAEDARVPTPRYLSRLSELVRAGLRDESPTAEEWAAWASADLPTASLNVTRGLAVRAAFLLRHAPGMKRRWPAVARALADRLMTETAPPVLAAFGFHLPYLLVGPDAGLRQAFESRLDEEEPWLAMFSTYVATNNSSSFDDAIRMQFDQAVAYSEGEKVRPDELEAVWRSVLIHAVSRFLWSPDREWEDLTFSALATSTPGQHADALNGLGHALRANPDWEVPTARLLELAQHVMDIRWRTADELAEVASGALNLVTAARVPVADSALVLRSLIPVAKQIPYRDLLPLLQAEASVIPATVVQVLDLALETHAQPWDVYRHAEAIVEVLEGLAQSPVRAQVEQLVETLGRRGEFFVEPVALQVVDT